VWPKVVIVPHAGYEYSGAVAAEAFSALEAGREVVHRVVVLGPSHHVAFDGVAVPSHDAFDTPLGRAPIDETARRDVLALPFVEERNDAHRWEHSLEVQLPFLQESLEGFSILPVAVGRTTAARISKLLERVWGGDETVVVVSSDLSHYHDYATATRMDTATAEAIEALEPGRIGPESACGRTAVQGALGVAATRGLTVQRLDLRNSGDTAGDRRHVVGYGAWAMYEDRGAAVS
jgi:AmmeMemoRadiSam system protein B